LLLTGHSCAAAIAAAKASNTLDFISILTLIRYDSKQNVSKEPALSQRMSLYTQSLEQFQWYSNVLLGQVVRRHSSSPPLTVLSTTITGACGPSIMHQRAYIIALSPIPTSRLTREPRDIKFRQLHAHAIVAHPIGSDLGQKRPPGLAAGHKANFSGPDSPKKGSLD
jgi:hypothetical protein